MLTVSNKSWHLRLVRFYLIYYQPRDLCSYFWMVVLFTLASIPLAVVMAVIMPIAWIATRIEAWGYEANRRYRALSKLVKPLKILALVLLGALLIAALTVLVIALLAEWRSILIALAAIIGLLAAMFLFMLLAAWGVDTIAQRRSSREHKPRQPNLIAEFVRAKKRRVCPLMQVAEEVSLGADVRSY
jgi:hypothetical protein